MITTDSATPSISSEGKGVDPVLRVVDLQVRFHVKGRIVHAVNGISFEVNEGQTLAIIGESGSGKSVTARAVMGLLPEGRSEASGLVFVGGRQIIGLGDREMSQVRGKAVALVPQDPSRSMNPTIRIGSQLAESLVTHLPLTRDEANKKSVELLEMVRIPAASERIRDYPHQLSGGMRQRVVIAMALACSPRVLIADEATTALDVTTQAQIMELLGSLQSELRMALVLISHDMGIAAEYTDKVAVMYAGRIVEEARTEDLFSAVRMPYTQALLDAIPDFDAPPHVKLEVVGGRPPDPYEEPSGCSFFPRCPRAQQRCSEEVPTLVSDEVGHRFACFYPLDEPKGAGS